MPPHDSSLAHEDATVSSHCYIDAASSSVTKAQSTGQAPGYLADDCGLSCTRPADVHSGQPISWQVRCRRHEPAMVTVLPSPARACGTTCHRLCDVNIQLWTGVEQLHLSGTHSTRLEAASSGCLAQWPASFSLLVRILVEIFGRSPHISSFVTCSLQLTFSAVLSILV